MQIVSRVGMGLFQKYDDDIFCYPSKNFHKHCFQISLGHFPFLLPAWNQQNSLNGF